MTKRRQKSYPVDPRAQIAEAARAEIERIKQAGGIIADEAQKSAMLRHMAETGDPRLFDLLFNLQNSEIILGFGADDREIDPMQRLQMLRYSRWFCVYNGFAADVVDTYGKFGFGSRADIASAEVDPMKRAEAQRVIDGFWKAPHNSYLLGDNEQRRLSDCMMQDGEALFVVIYNTSGGKEIYPELRKVAPEKFRIIYDEYNPDAPIWYVETRRAKQEYPGWSGEIYYPDWRATRQQLLENKPPKGAGVIGWRKLVGENVAAGDSLLFDENSPIDIGEGNIAKAIYEVYNLVGKRGLPTLQAAFPVMKLASAMVGDRATVSRGRASHISMMTVDGGSRDVTAAINQLQASTVYGQGYVDRNPPMPVAKTLVKNKAVDYENLSLDTGAGDAKSDFEILLIYAAICSKFPLEFWLPFEMTNRATAEQTLARFWQSANGYKGFWAAIYRRIIWVVLSLYKAYNPTLATYESYDVDVSLNTPLDSDPDKIIAAMGAIADRVGDGTLSKEEGIALINALVILLVDAVGVDEAQSVLDEVRAKMAAVKDEAPDIPDTAPVSAIPGMQSQAPVSAVPGQGAGGAQAVSAVPARANEAIIQATRRFVVGEISPEVYAEFIASEVEAANGPAPVLSD